MRSRTEMVTTTFVDSEEDYSDDDSEEDWRPSVSSKNGKKQNYQKLTDGGSAKGRKRKNWSDTRNKNLKRKNANDDSEDDNLNMPSEDDYEHDDTETISILNNKSVSLSSTTEVSDKKLLISSNEDSGDILRLLIYVEDIRGSDLITNNRLCLWRKDNNNLLQKYIRVKTSPEQYLFTSSSVYSSFDDKRMADFYEIKVKSIDLANRRVKIINPAYLHKICVKDLKNKSNSDDGKKPDIPKGQ